MAESVHRPRNRVGTTVRGKYRLDAFLATGTMANVYSATHRNGSKVALKILHRDYAHDPRLAERFKREGYFANSIGHPGVIRAIDDDVTEDGCPFLVMELLEGETLEQRRQRKGGRLPLIEALGIMDAVLDVLAAAHDKHVLHRDMKPDNVFLTNAGELKLLDFGVARWDDGQSSSDMTGAGMVLGTPAFMPPEQALGRREDVDARSDLWAVGAMLFVVLTGQPVHAGNDAKQRLIATARTPARPIQEVDPTIPRSVATVIDRALAFDRDARWPDAHAMREALRWARLSLEPAAPRAGRIPTLTDEVPAPAPTKRNFDEELTVARRSPSGEVYTSAPALTPAGGMPASAQTSSAVFPLTREKDEEDAPKTERFDRPVTPSVDINLSFTRPMAAMEMPDGLRAGSSTGPIAAAAPASPPHTPAGGSPILNGPNVDVRRTLPFGVFAPGAGPAAPETQDTFAPVPIRVAEGATAEAIALPAPGAQAPALTLSMPPPPDRPGPKVVEVVEARQRGQGLRVGAILLVAAGVLAGAYVLVVKRGGYGLPGATATTATAAPSAAASASPSAAAAVTVAAATATTEAPAPAEAASAAAEPAAASAAPATVALAAATPPAAATPTARPRPRAPRPAASAAPSTPASAASAAPSAPLPTATTIAPAKEFDPPSAPTATSAPKAADPPEAPKPAPEAPKPAPLPGDQLF